MNGTEALPLLVVSSESIPGSSDAAPHGFSLGKIEFSGGCVHLAVIE